MIGELYVVLGLLAAVLVVVAVGRLMGAVGKLTTEVASLKAEKAKAQLAELQNAFTPAELATLGDAFTTIDKLVSARLGVEQKQTTMFSTQNIFTHGLSSLLGLVVGAALLSLPIYFKVATFDQVSPLLLLVVPFLLYGRKGGPGAGGAVAALVLAGLLTTSCASMTGPNVSVRAEIHYHAAPHSGRGAELLRPCWQSHTANKGVRYEGRVRRRQGLLQHLVRGLLSVLPGAGPGPER